ncbi:MAG: TonB-dependent receptor [Proteobacteria bacterium]|nr:TonB-dependent receptor [Pseudomonadota bacterium]MBU1583152.1 TonB-dependent receptor [Pseudomonadota bacterium]MBU2452929.1 TonB-dependent receptor [Pseudomonadota bacterium]MBU2627519.1 TonB-dependent receptor [Pseudomonadota bacterium]
MFYDAFKISSDSKQKEKSYRTKTQLCSNWAYKTNFIPETESFSCFSPRAGLNYLFDTGLRLHSTIGKAFVPPTAAQLAENSQGTGGKTTVGNPNLDPESSITYDAGMGCGNDSFYIVHYKPISV